MIQAYGLKTHIWNNNLRSVLLLVLFPVLLLGLAYAAMLIYFGLTSNMSPSEGLIFAADYDDRHVDQGAISHAFSAAACL